MKNSKILRTVAIFLSSVLFTLNVSAFAAENVNSVKGFWMVEVNVKKPNGSVIRFYTDDAKQIYQEYVPKVSLDISRPKTVVLLNAALDEAMINWEINHKIETNGNIVADLKKRGVDDQLYAGGKK